MAREILVTTCPDVARKVTEFDKCSIFFVSETSDNTKWASCLIDSSSEDDSCTTREIALPNAGSSGSLHIADINLSFAETLLSLLSVLACESFVFDGVLFCTAFNLTLNEINCRL